MDKEQLKYEMELLIQKRRDFVNKWWVKIFIPKFIRDRY